MYFALLKLKFLLVIFSEEEKEAANHFITIAFSLISFFECRSIESIFLRQKYEFADEGRRVLRLKIS
jgi:DNA-binding XRE family transcriptional regulator